jgi:tripartite motif-containing protein 71
VGSVTANGNVYDTDNENHRVQYFTATGSYLGKWGTRGTGNGQLDHPTGIAISPAGEVYVGDSRNDRVQYFTLSGSYIGQWGVYGTGNGEFDWVHGIAFTSGGMRVYVVDYNNERVQYFKWTEPGVEPTSLGKIKAVFR